MYRAQSFYDEFPALMTTKCSYGEHQLKMVLIAYTMKVYTHTHWDVCSVFCIPVNSGGPLVIAGECYMEATSQNNPRPHMCTHTHTLKCTCTCTHTHTQIIQGCDRLLSAKYMCCQSHIESLRPRLNYINRASSGLVESN